MGAESELMKATGHIHAEVTDEVASHAALARLAYPDGELRQEQNDDLAALAPHLRTVAQLTQRLADLEAARDRLHEALDRLVDAVLIVDTSLSLLEANQAGQDLLDARDGLRLARGGGEAAARLRPFRPDAEAARARRSGRPERRHGCRRRARHFAS